MEIDALLQRQDAEITAAHVELKEAEENAAAANERAAFARDKVASLMAERRIMERLARRYGALPAEPPTPPAEDDWTSLNRLDAVEKALQNGPLHLGEIEIVLQQHGRTDDTYALISASLATLRRRRKSVKPLGGGRWATDPDGIAQQRVMSRIATDQRLRIFGDGLQLPPPREPREERPADTEVAPD
jgi:hypothetical protein